MLFTDTRPNGLAVLNYSAERIWDQFDTSRSVQQVLESLPDFAPNEVGGVVRDLWRHGFLLDSLPQRPFVSSQDTLIVWLHVTNACNLRCSYCYVRKTDGAMDEDTADSAISAIFKTAIAYRYGRIKVKYAGGEALLNFRRILETHDKAQALANHHAIKLEGVVLSNGIGLSKRHVDALQQRDLRLMISLDGVDAAHDAQRVFAGGSGSSARVRLGIETALQHGLVPTISVTVSASNAAALSETVEWLLDRDLPFSLNFYRECDASSTVESVSSSEQSIIDGMLNAFKVIENNLPRRSLLNSLVDRANLSMPHFHTCAAGTDYLVIDHNGHVTNCQMRLDSPVADIYAVDLLGAIRQSPLGIGNVSVDEKEECCSCTWKYWCAGGCPIETYRATGRYDLKSPNCHIYQTLYPAVVRLEALRLLKYSQAVA
ncbi:MAG: SPASM domain-containing protein [Anaerolineae bacterium]